MCSPCLQMNNFVVINTLHPKLEFVLFNVKALYMIFDKKKNCFLIIPPITKLWNQLYC